MSYLPPCREAFTDSLLQLAQLDKDIIAVTTDARGSVTLGKFAETLPKQFVEIGIAEQNAVGVAAGLASCGKKVFVCGPACFLSARSLEQVKVDVAYTNTNVKVIGVSGGVSYGALGSSHHSLHDIAVFRAIPNITVVLPCDRWQTKAMTQVLADCIGPVYVRMGRNAVPDVYEGETFFEIGKANTLLHGSDLTIIATGETVRPALDAGNLLKAEGIKVRVIDMHTIKPLDNEIILKAAKETGRIITVEEHSVHGGLGAAVAELTSQNHPVKLKIMGIPDESAIAGSSKEIFNHYNLTAEGIKKEAINILA